MAVSTMRCSRRFTAVRLRPRLATVQRSVFGRKRQVIDGNPDHINTSYIERANLTMRMGMRRFTRLTNAFSKKIVNHAAAVALHMMHYNFVRIHQTLRITTVMAAGITDRVGEITNIVALLEAEERGLERAA